MSISLKFEPRDCWIGVFWEREPLLDISDKKTLWITGFHWKVYVCILPCLPLCFSWLRDLKEPIAALTTVNEV